MLSRWTIGKKLTYTVTAMLAVTFLMGAAAMRSIGHVSDNLENAVRSTAPKLQYSGRIKSAAADMTAGHRGFLLYLYTKRPDGADKSQRMFETGAEQWKSALGNLRALLATEEEKQLGASLARDLDEWTAVFAEVQKTARAGDIEGGMNLAVAKALPLALDARKLCDRLDEIQNNLLGREQDEAESLQRTNNWIALGVGTFSVLLGMGALWLVRQTSSNLQKTASELSRCSDHVSSASTQLASSSQSLAHGASEQAASLEETSASSEEVTSMTRRNASNSNSAAELVTETAHVVENANQSLGEMQTSMQEINASSDKISRIIKVIDEIAFQTNILALNAAVEAARAGEAGMGFAVVADEVRNLAQRSAQAAKDTASLIEESIAKSNEGRGKLDHVAAAIREITKSSSKVRALVDEVKLGSEEQSRGIEQISKAITQMQTVTQKSAASAEETASAGQKMNAQAETLNAIVDRLHQLVGGREEQKKAAMAGTKTAASPAGQPKAQARAATSPAHELAALGKAVAKATGSAETTGTSGARPSSGSVPAR